MQKPNKRLRGKPVLLQEQIQELEKLLLWLSEEMGQM